MAMRIHLGMINDTNWEIIKSKFLSEFPEWNSSNLWMKKYYDAIEVTDQLPFEVVGNFRVFEFKNQEKYTEFCMTWL